MRTETIRREWATKLSPLHFEEGSYPAFHDTVAYLTHLYGDYMELPPKELRYPDHQELAIRIKIIEV